MKRLLGYIRRCDEEYSLIGDNETIAVALSGGKDSMAMLKALKLYQRFCTRHFTLVAICVDLGFSNMDFDAMRAFCDVLEVPLTIKSTQIADIVFTQRKEHSPCSLCAKMRKGALHDAAIEAGSRKIALGHHRDDYIETFLLSLFYEGRIHNFKPKTYLDRKQLFAIRPMLFCSEAEIRHVVKTEQIPVVKNKCPIDGLTKREEMKAMLKELRKKIPRCDDRIFTACKQYMDTFGKDGD